jgi:hypothetical protein
MRENLVLFGFIFVGVVHKPLLPLCIGFNTSFIVVHGPGRSSSIFDRTPILRSDGPRPGEQFI